MATPVSQPFVAWTLRELRHTTSGVSVDDFRRALTALTCWCATSLCLLQELPPAAQDVFRIFHDTIQQLQHTVAALLGRTFTGPQATLQWRSADNVLVPSLDGAHMMLADLWVDLSALDGLHMEELVEAVSASSCLFPGQERMVLVSHVSGTFVKAIAEVYKRQFQHARAPHSSDEEWDVLICGPQTQRDPPGPSVGS